MQWYEDLVGTMKDAVAYLADDLRAGNILTEASSQMLADFSMAMELCADRLACEDGILTEKCRRYALNAAHSAKKMIDAETPKAARNLFFFEVRPLFLDLCYQLDLEYHVLHHPAKRAEHLKHVLSAFEQARKRPRRTDFKYRVSIIVPAYNKEEFSRCAIESLFRHTDFSRGDIELITINDGSTDGTEAFFNSLPHEKKINLKYNVYNHLGWGIARHIVEGQYVVYFSNDAVATPRWLENLLTIHETLPNVFWTVPTCNENGISNAQGLPVDYENTFADMGKMETFAEKNNQSDPLRWEQRAILMPFVSVVPNLFDVPEIRADYAYTMCDFEDDDFSTMLRRTGFQQILAKDTFIHHFGSVTLKEIRNLPKNRSSIARMRPVFRDKWHVDPWQSRGHVELIDTFLDQHNVASPVRALVIEPLFGEGLLYIRNYFHQKQKKVVIDAIVTDERYLPDSKYLADTVHYLPTLDNFAEQMQKEYDIILLGTYLNRLPVKKLLPFFKACHERLRPHGGIHCRILNRHSFGYIMQMLTLSDASLLTCEEPIPLDGERIFSINELIEVLRAYLPQIALQMHGLHNARYAQQEDSFAALVSELLDCTAQEKTILQDFLLKDMLILYLS